MSLLDDVDGLYASCVMDPGRWNDQAFADWVDAVSLTEGIDREVTKLLRRCLNAARRLAAFWVAADTARAPDDWRGRVDLALGVRAWRPQLDLARLLLERNGDRATFERVAELFPVVTNQPFLDGIDYQDWVHGSVDPGAGGTIGR